VFIGYPNALYDKTNFTPIARRGYTATPVALDYCGTPSFLVDASVFPGSSGSPVFIYQEGYRQGNSYMLGATRLLFVGVVASVQVQHDVGQIITGSLPKIAFNQILDLGLVFNWRAVIETVENLLKVHRMPVGTQVPEIAQGQDEVQISTQEEPPARPNAL
jgi:hypothetical protein